MSTPTVDNAIVDTIPGAQARLGGISRSMVYELLAQGELEGVKLGRRRMITVASMVAYIDRLRSQVTA